MTPLEKRRAVTHALRQIYFETYNRTCEGTIAQHHDRIHVYDKNGNHVLSMSEQTLKDYSK